MSEVGEDEVVLSERRGAVAWITLNRPGALNAISQSMRRALPAAVSAAASDPEVRAIILRGAGERAFCAGADVKEFQAVESVAKHREQRIEAPWIKAVAECRKPVIAVIHGFCLGGGLEIALACDIRIAADDAVMGLPEVGLGIITGVGGSQRLLRAVGLARALHLLLTGERLPAAEAERWGLITKVVPRSDLEARASEIAEAIAAKPPLAIRFAKEVLNRGWDLALDAGCTLETDLSALLMNTEDRLEAARAFREKRPPSFQGR